MPLRRALADESHVVRARAFDIVYNMAIHGELLLPTEAGTLAAEMEVCICDLAASSAVHLLHACPVTWLDVSARADACAAGNHTDCRICYHQAAAFSLTSLSSSLEGLLPLQTAGRYRPRHPQA